MASSVSFGDMKQRVRELANIETNSGASDFVSDAELGRRLNAALAELYDKLVAAYPQEHYAWGETFNVGTGMTELTLPGDFYKLLHISFRKDDTIYHPKIFQFIDTSSVHQADLNATAQMADYRYRLSRNKVLIAPTPREDFELIMQYIPAFPKFATDGSADASTFDGVNGWEEWACLKAAIGCMVKEETDPSFLMADLASQDARIKRLATDRDVSQVETVHDTLGASEYGRGAYWSAWDDRW